MLKTSSLTNEVKEITIEKGTEYCNSGTYNNRAENGSYLCRNCGLALFRSHDKFKSGSGWPSFDTAIDNTVRQVMDSDKVRTELLCSRCDGHLGHVFYGEGYTKLNVRYCINSLALDFVAKDNVQDTEEAIVAAGCFWGVEYLFAKLEGVLKTEVGYIGGRISNPSYETVCDGNTGHVEAIRIIYNPKVINYNKIIQYFFEIHDFAQSNGQGNDVGEQYLGKIFYFNDVQQKEAQNVVNVLKTRGYEVATKLEPVSTFWVAEEYHQGYYDKSDGRPYCHVWRKIF